MPGKRAASLQIEAEAMARPAPKAEQKSIYAVHPGVLMENASIANLYRNTGKTLEEWIQLVRESGAGLSTKASLRASPGKGGHRSARSEIHNHGQHHSRAR